MLPQYNPLLQKPTTSTSSNENQSAATTPPNGFPNIYTYNPGDIR